MDRKLSRPTSLPVPIANMITDGQLYQLAIFFGVAAMLLIVVYHFLEVNAPKGTVAGGKEEATKSL